MESEPNTQFQFKMEKKNIVQIYTITEQRIT